MPFISPWGRLGAEGRRRRLEQLAVPWFVDESIRSSAALYIFATVRLSSGLPQARQALRSLVPRRAGRFHWRNEIDGSRRRLLGLASALDVTAVVYVCHGVQKSERARARCFERMLWELMQRERDAELVFESRQERNDRRDRRSILRAQHTGMASSTLRYTFERPIVEPLLWLPDGVAGAVGASRVDSEDYLDLLKVEIVEV
jgi:hypothetical protein